MNAAPVNPDRRPLPPGWNEHYDASSQTWYYVCTNYHPPRVSTTHPLGHPTSPSPTALPTMPQDDDVPFIRVPGTLPPSNFPAQASTLSPAAARLYASAVQKYPSPTLPAPGIPFVTPPPSPHPSSTHRSQSYSPASPPHFRNHNVHRAHTYVASTPVLTTKAEAPKDFTADAQVHTTAALPPYAPPHLQVHSQPTPTAAYPSPPNVTSNNTTSITVSGSVYPQHLPLTPLSPQIQDAHSTINHTGQQYQSVYSALQPSYAAPAPDAAAQAAAQQTQAQAQAQAAQIQAQAQAQVVQAQVAAQQAQAQAAAQQAQAQAIAQTSAQAQAMLIQQQQQQLTYQQQQVALQQQQVGLGMYGQQQQQQQQQNNLGDRLLTAFVRGAVGGAVSAVLGS